jgi:hypothetical protein
MFQFQFSIACRDSDLMNELLDFLCFVGSDGGGVLFKMCVLLSLSKLPPISPCCCCYCFPNKAEEEANGLNLSQ